MAIQHINYGAAPDDGTGDPLRVAFKKTDDNFTELDSVKANETDVSDALNGKVDKVSGMGLSTEDFTTSEKEKLDGVEDGAQVNPGVATDSVDGLMSAEDKTKLDGVEDGAQVNPGVATDTVDGLMSAEDKTKLDGIVLATDTVDGLMSAEDKTKLDGVEDGATANSSDSYLLDRANHTGEQSIATITSLSAALPSIVKSDYRTPCLIKTAAQSISIKSGTRVKISGTYISFDVDTAVTMPSLTGGEDYCVWVKPDGVPVATADPYSSPATPPAIGSVKIGGFHYGLVAPGTTTSSGSFSTTGFTNIGGNYIWDQSKVDRIAGINEFSIWDLNFKSKGEQHGFSLDPQTRVWLAIYFCGTEHITNGISRYNTDVASGTVLPKIPVAYGGNETFKYGRLSAYESIEVLASHGCRLITFIEFASAAFGVTEKQSLGGASSTIPATKREPGYTSRIGLEQTTGHIWTVGGPLTSSGGDPWVSNPNRGSIVGSDGIPLFGGTRLDSTESGSRTSRWNRSFDITGWNVGLRAACDHYQGYN